MKTKVCHLFSLLLWPSFLLLSRPLHSQTNITASSNTGLMRSGFWRSLRKRQVHCQRTFHHSAPVLSFSDYGEFKPHC
jgi:hypothetical protein